MLVDIAVDMTTGLWLELKQTCERRGGAPEGWVAVGVEAGEQAEVSEDEREGAPVPLDVALFGSHQLRDEPHQGAHVPTFALKEGTAAHLTATHGSEKEILKGDLWC